jgi:hypothetical protein
MNELNFYSVLAQIIEHYPKPLTNKAGYTSEPYPQFFCVITNPSDLETANYGKTERHIKKTFFFDRKGENKKQPKVTYPAISLLPKGGFLDMINGKKTVAFNMLIEDSSPIANGNPSGNIGQELALRVVEEVQSGLAEMGAAILREAIQNFIFARIFPPAAAPSYTAWASKIYLAQLKAQNLISNFEMIEKLSDRITTQNAAPCLTLSDNTGNRTIGYMIDFSVQLDACPQNINFDYTPFDKNFSPLPQNCC